MKKVIIVAIVAANAFLACKKDRACECTVTRTGTSTTTAALTFSIPLVGNVPVIDTSFVTPVSDVFKYEKTLTKVSRAAAKSNCIDYKEPYKETTTNSAPPLLLTTLEEGTRTYDCELK